MIDRFARAALSYALALTVFACGGKDSDTDDAASSADDQAGGSETTPAAQAPSDPLPAATAPVKVEDVDRWQRGMTAELAAVRAAGERLKAARTSDDTLSAMMAVQEMATQEAGAEAAGIDLERYKFIRGELSAAVSYMTPHLGGIDTTILSPAQRDELRQSNEAQLQQMEERVPADVMAALRPRAEALRTRDLELVATRLKAAGM
jgi:hypothetical protein